MSTDAPTAPTTMAANANPLATPLPWDLVADAYEAEVAPSFAPFARAALEQLAPLAGKRLLDVACGPGTVTLAAAPSAAHVTALDFSPAMIAQLELRAREQGLTNVTALVGDGQALPFGDASFDGACSTFGLMFFPDRARGFAELARVLRPGARAVVTSWLPPRFVPHIETMFGALREALRARAPAGTPEAPPPPVPLATPEDYHAELGAAGFHDIDVQRVETTLSTPSTDALWAGFARTMAPLVLMQRQQGAAFEPIAEAIRAALHARFGAGPQEVTLPAWVGSGQV